MNRDQHLQEIVSKLESKKGPYLDKLSRAIEAHIVSQSTTDCLTLVLRNKQGRIVERWKPQRGIGYADRLIAFVRNAPYAGYTVDSAITDDVTRLATDQFNKFYEQHTDLITVEFTAAMMQNPRVKKAFADAISRMKPVRFAKAEVKSQIFELLLGSLKDQIYDVSGMVALKVGGAVTAAAGTAASVPVIKAIIAKFGAVLAVHIKVLILKLVAIPAVKKIIMSIVSKYVLVAMVGSFIKLIIAKTGMGIGAVVAIVLAPIIVAILAYEWFHFPEKLGKEVASGVKEQLSGDFTAVNFDVLSALYNQVVDTAITDFNKWVQDDPELEEEVDRLVSLLSA